MAEANDSNEDLRKAIALSLDSAKVEDNHNDNTVDESATDEGKYINGKAKSIDADSRRQADHLKMSTQAQETTGIRGLDRKAMEQERLARLAVKSGGIAAHASTSKRKAEISPPPCKRMRMNRGEPQAKQSKPRKISAQTLRFPRGVIKRTSSPSHGNETGITIDDIIDKDNVNIAVLSAFLIDADWIISKFDKSRTKFYMVLHANRQADRDMYEADFQAAGPNVRLCLPELSGPFATMHSKLMLLFYQGFLRIVVPTANLIDFDWGETGVMENTVFLVDLPRLVTESRTVEELPMFGQELHRFLNAQGLQTQVLDALLKFDFEATKDLAFIHTSAGAHYGRDMEHTGLTGLSKAVEQLGLSTNHPIQIEIATSSLGSLNDNLINSIYEAARGKDIVRNRDHLKKANAIIKKNTRIYFPTHNTVRSSRAGSAGTICLQRNYFDKPDFPRDLLRDYVSTRKGLLSHNKIMLVRSKNKAWVYVGSANLSESAWGRVVVDRSKKQVKLSCSNWECGVLVSVEDDGELDDGMGKGQGDINKVFGETLDVPFVCGEEVEDRLKYKERLPWFFKED